MVRFRKVFLSEHCRALTIRTFLIANSLIADNYWGIERKGSFCSLYATKFLKLLINMHFSPEGIQNKRKDLEKSVLLYI